MPFSQESLKAFSFLATMSFHAFCTEPTRTQYQSSATVVTIDWDPNSGEIEAWFRLRSTNETPAHDFSLSDVLIMEGVPVPAPGAPFQIASEATFGPLLEILAERTRRHARLALAGDRNAVSATGGFQKCTGRGVHDGEEGSQDPDASNRCVAPQRHGTSDCSFYVYCRPFDRFGQAEIKIRETS